MRTREIREKVKKRTMITEKKQKERKRKQDPIISEMV